MANEGFAAQIIADAIKEHTKAMLLIAKALQEIANAKGVEKR